MPSEAIDWDRTRSAFFFESSPRRSNDQPPRFMLTPYSNPPPTILTTGQNTHRPEDRPVPQYRGRPSIQIAPSRNIRMPFLQLLRLITTLDNEGLFDQATGLRLDRLVIWEDVYHRIARRSAAHPHRFTTSGTSAYKNALLHLCFQYELFRLVRHALTRPHRDGDLQAMRLRGLHVLLVAFREQNQPTAFVDATLNDTDNAPLHLPPRIAALRAALHASGRHDDDGDAIGQMIARMSAHSIEDDEWVECMSEIMSLRLVPLELGGPRTHQAARSPPADMEREHSWTHGTADTVAGEQVSELVIERREAAVEWQLLMDRIEVEGGVLRDLHTERQRVMREMDRETEREMERRY